VTDLLNIIIVFYTVIIMFRLAFATLIFLSLAAYTCFASTPTQNGYFINLNTIKLIQCVTEDGHYEGTGFVIAKDRVVTANHVIYGATACVIDHKPVKLISHETDLDVAVLEVDLGPNPAVLPFSCDGYQEGETYFSIGYAHGLDFAMTKLIGTGDFTDIGGDDEYPYAGNHFSKITGIVIPGMSGGPIIDTNGRVVGINNLSDGGDVGLSRSLADTSLCAALRKTDGPLYPMPAKTDVPADLFKLLPPIVAPKK
jgi:S1-C subfamily serine protease